MSPGDIPLKVNEVNGVKLGMMICFDWAFPETTRTLAMNNAEIIFRATSQRETCYITNIDPAESHDKFITKHNNLFSDRRPDFYEH